MSGRPRQGALVGPFPSAPRRTRRAALTAAGSPAVMPWVAW